MMIAAKNIASKANGKDEKTMDKKEMPTDKMLGDSMPKVDGYEETVRLDGDDRAGNIRMRLLNLPMAAMRLIREYRKNAKRHAVESISGIILGLCAYLFGSARLLLGQALLDLRFSVPHLKRYCGYLPGFRCPC